MIAFTKFVIVGVLNTVIDLGVLNLLVFVYGTGEHNERYVIFKIISFILGVLNSYIFNKFWVFKNESKGGVKEPVLFFVISGIGLVLNVAVSTLSYSYLFSKININMHIAVTAGGIAGSIVVLLWNFFGYKLFVFSK